MTYSMVRTAVAAWIAVVVLALPVRLAAQAPPAPGIRMIATYDPAADSRTFRVLEPMSGSEILAIQTALARAGSDPGPLDGRLGPSTRRALERFQRGLGLAACGCVSYQTIIALGLKPLVVQTIIGTMPDVQAVEVLLPQGLPPASGARPSEPGGAAEGAARAGQGAPVGQGAEPGRIREYVERDAGWWVPVYPFHPPILEPLRGSRGQPSGGSQGDGGRGGILVGPSAGGSDRQAGQGERSGGVRVIRPPRGAPRSGPPRRSGPPPRPRP